jgi:hypothetical protein
MLEGLARGSEGGWREVLYLERRDEKGLLRIGGSWGV